MIKPLNGRVLIKPRDVEEVSEGGIILLKDSQEEKARGQKENATPTPQGGSPAESGPQPTQGDADPASAASPETQEMSPEDAKKLLEAMSQEEREARRNQKPMKGNVLRGGPDW